MLPLVGVDLPAREGENAKRIDLWVTFRPETATAVPPPYPPGFVNTDNLLTPERWIFAITFATER